MPTAASHVWRPSTARVAVLDGFVPVPRGASALTPAPLAWAAKDPADVLDYIIDMSAAFVGNDADSIATVDTSVAPDAPGDLQINSVAVDGSAVVLWLSGGQAGTVYAVTATIGTSNGRVLSRTVQLPVLALAIVPVPSQAINVDTGVMLTDENGNPVLAD